jgi:hypothetical protein
MPDNFNQLGMNWRIPRRDFLNGAAVITALGIDVSRNSSIRDRDLQK